MSNMTPKALFEALLSHPRPPYTVPPRLTMESTNPRQCLIRMNGSEIHYDGAQWSAYDWSLPAELPADASPEQISAEIERVRTFWTQHSNVTDASVWKRKAQEFERALNGIAGLVGIGTFGDPDTIRLVVKDVRAAHDTAQARIKELEAKIAHDVANSAARDMRIKELEAKHATEIKASSTVNTSLMRQISKAHEALDAAGIPRSAEEDGEPGSPWTLGQRIAVLLIPGDDESPAEWAIDELDKIVHGEPRPFACDLDKLINAVKVMKSDIAAVWELWGAGREVKPGALHELCQEHERLSSALESKLRVIAESLDEADIPKRYGDSVDGGPIPVEERVALALTELEECGELMKTYNRQVVAFVGEVDAANAELCRLGAPRKAGDVFLNLVHRIRALPGLLRKD